MQVAIADSETTRPPHAPEIRCAMRYASRSKYLGFEGDQLGSASKLPPLAIEDKIYKRNHKRVFVKSCGWILPQNSGERPVDRRFVHVRRCSEIARESGMITLGDWLRARGADPEHFSEAAAFG
jgi:hypothetical protein